VLVRLPYDKCGRYTFMPQIAPFFLDRGFAFVVQDVRGKFRSEGETIAFVREVEDGADTLDWLASQTWCDGDVGMWGDSYYGFTQWAAVAAFTTSSDFLETSRAAYRERRDLLVGGLNELGLTCATPAGAFYAFPDISRINPDSREASEILLNRAQVATVPGAVFGPDGEGHVRFSFSTSLETIQGGLDSMRRNL